jgi:glycosyltransferase involved in cell wall biosynthesis
MPAAAIDDSLPRVLILSNQTPQTVYAGCILLHRLFGRYPADRLFVIGQKTHPKALLLACQYRAIIPPLQRLHTTRLAGIKRSLDTFGVTPNISPRQVRKLLGEFKPDVVVSVMEERYAHAAGRYAAAARIPLVLIVHDEPELFDAIYPWAKKQQIKTNAALYASAAARLNVSPEMEQHLFDLYGTHGDVMYPNRSEELVARPLEQSRQLKKPGLLTIGYAGTLAYGYGEQLRNLARAIRGSAIRLRVYGPVDRQTDLLVTEFSDVVDCPGLISPPERLWPLVQSECDSVILPYSWSAVGASVELYRTHFPSKLPEYLALGMPVIVMGPAFGTGVAWGIRNPEAVVRLDREEPVYWVQTLDALRTDDDRRVKLAEAAGVAGDRDFDPVRIREHFVRRLKDVAAK